jgi:hypothetical protein
MVTDESAKTPIVVIVLANLALIYPRALPVLVILLMM